MSSDNKPEWDDGKPENVEQALAWSADCVNQAMVYLTPFDVPEVGEDASASLYPTISDACAQLDNVLFLLNHERGIAPGQNETSNERQEKT